MGWYVRNMSENIKFALLYGCKLSQISQPGTLRSPMTCMKPYQKYVHEYDRYGTDMVQIWYSIWVGGNNLWTIMNQPPWFARYALPERQLTAIMADQMPIRKVDVQLAGYSWIVSRQYPSAALNTAGYLLILDTSYNSANSLHQVTGSSRTVWEYLGYLGYCLMNVLPGLWKQLHVNSVDIFSTFLGRHFSQVNGHGLHMLLHLRNQLDLQMSKGSLVQMISTSKSPSDINSPWDLRKTWRPDKGRDVVMESRKKNNSFGKMSISPPKCQGIQKCSGNFLMFILIFARKNLYNFPGKSKEFFVSHPGSSLGPPHLGSPGPCCWPGWPHPRSPTGSPCHTTRSRGCWHRRPGRER